MTFKIGQTVVCRNTSTSNTQNLIVGQKYSVVGLPFIYDGEEYLRVTPVPVSKNFDPLFTVLASHFSE